MLKYPSGQIIIAKWVYVPMRTHLGIQRQLVPLVQGIGLCRTEHMFFEGERIWAIREFILAEDERARKGALAKLLKHQQKDFEGIFKAMDGLPVTVRLLDPPLHEFVPHTKKDQQEMAKRLGVSAKKVVDRVQSLHEHNPMLGHRGMSFVYHVSRIVRDANASDYWCGL